jgi:PAS domain S-box-containing protein
VEVHLLPHLRQPATPDGALRAHHRHHAPPPCRRQLRESEERLAKFMHASAEGIVFHKGGFVTDANPPLLDLMGYTLPEMMGRPTLDFVAPDHARASRSVIGRLGDHLRQRRRAPRRHAHPGGVHRAHHALPRRDSCA